MASAIEETDPTLSGRPVRKFAPQLRPRAEQIAPRAGQLARRQNPAELELARLQALAATRRGESGTRDASPAEQAEWRAATRVITVSDPAAFGAAPSTSVPFVSAVQQVEFLQDGYIVGASFGIRSSAQNFANLLGVKLETVGKGQGITTDGETAQFIASNLLCGSGPLPGVCPLVRRVRANDRINVTYCNYSTTQSTLQPAGSFLFLRDCDLPDGCDPEPVGTGLPGATRILQVPVQNNFSNPIAVGAQGAPGTVVMPASGLLVGFRAGDTNWPNTSGPLANLELWTQIENLQGNQEALTTDGRALAFAPISFLCAGPDECLRLLRRVKLNDRYRVTFKNRSSVAEGTVFAPQGVFFLRADEDVMSRGLLG